MWALRSLLGQADPGDHEAGDEPSPTAPTANSGERATADMPTLRERAYGRMPTSGAQPGRRLIADTYHREQHGPQAHRQDDPRGRLWRDATLVLLAFMVVAAVVIGVQPTGFLGGVGGVTATPAPVPPVAVMTVSLVATCTADSPATYSFSGATSTEGASYAWAFSSGIAGSTAVTVARDLPGSTAGTTYTITLTVENAVGASDTDSAEITVICP